MHFSSTPDHLYQVETSREVDCENQFQGREADSLCSVKSGVGEMKDMRDSESKWTRRHHFV